MNFSATINLRTPAQKNGLNTARLQIILNRKTLHLPLGFSWPEALFDAGAGYCLVRLPTARRKKGYDEALQNLQAAVGPDLAAAAEHNNLIIGKALGDANAVARRYHLNGQFLTVDEFQREYNSSASRADFLEYMEKRITKRWRLGQISESTKKKHLSTLYKLQEYLIYLQNPRKHKPWGRGYHAGRPAGTPHVPLPFNSFTHDFAGDFDSWMKSVHKSCTNTRSGRHRNIKAYLTLARRDKIAFEDPYEYFVNKRVDGKWKALSEDELALLEHHYTQQVPRSWQRRVLQKFLFSCHCGLRLGDLKQVGKMKIEGQLMELMPHKTYQHDEKDLVLPITKKALGYLQDSQRENECAGFHLYADQATNTKLRKIGAALGIKTKLHHHVGRETFATHFSRQGGKVEVLQKLMGHKHLTMTMKYVHVDAKMKQAEIDRLDALHA
ncbi:site-specific integrase [Hymenobacter sp. ASUV-10]|uniref:Site-specific integrase n=1 Tax=Hymenobacter aranciens TaxID=3063996 RepID=A0ABT9BHE9_9BACT|nr:site-specific integrase [Hymenobacter sp. ASUV-10]MDO7877684.1 site-specific integrase [Hymenobacter sp. ASUV-10]